jgi:hypothetical protein
MGEYSEILAARMDPGRMRKRQRMRKRHNRFVRKRLRLRCRFGIGFISRSMAKRKLRRRPSNQGIRLASSPRSRRCPHDSDKTR